MGFKCFKVFLQRIRQILVLLILPISSTVLVRWDFWAVSSNFGEKRLMSGNSASNGGYAIATLKRLSATLVSSLNDPGTSEGAPEEAAASTWVHWMPLDAAGCRCSMVFRHDFIQFLVSDSWQCSSASMASAEEEPRSCTPGNAEVWQPSFARGHSWPHRLVSCQSRMWRTGSWGDRLLLALVLP